MQPSPWTNPANDSSHWTSLGQTSLSSWNFAPIVLVLCVAIYRSVYLAPNRRTGLKIDRASSIPGPPELPFVGNIGDIDNVDVPLLSLHGLADKYGEIYQLRFPGQNPVVFISNVSLTNEICDEKRFRKKISSLLVNLGKGLRNGMFTINTDDEGWGVAHRILMPAFGTMSIRSMFPEMRDIANQMALKWARHGGQPIPVTDDMTRLTLDTLGLCGMGFRFNSFYMPDALHPFVESMQRFMFEADSMVRRPPLPGVFYRGRDRQFWDDIEVMRRTAEEVVRARRNNLTGVHDSKRTDLLEAMLHGVDPKTGKMLTDDLIIDNLIGFLAAGHETTSGMLSFAIYELLRHPDAMRRARAEVDAVCGTGAITAEHMSQLKYVAAVLRETLRLHPTIPGFMVEAVEDTVIGSGYKTKKGQTVTCLVGAVHLDKAVYGEDSHEFKPERMSDEPFREREKRFGHCWKPFGNGLRACIGRPFAWQEALLAVAVLLQNFDLDFADPGYTLQLKQCTTVKPKGFRVVATLRDGMTPTTLEHRLNGPARASDKAQPDPKTKGRQQKDVRHVTETATDSITILYGSESGTCEALAQKLANDAGAHGVRVASLGSLDSATGKLPPPAAGTHPSQPGTVVIITPSYEGQPPANAKSFVAWLEAEASGDSKHNSMSGLRYAVYGCGDSAWSTTFHRVPKLIDEALTRLGAQRAAPLGLTDMAAAEGDVFGEFEAWEDEVLWPALGDGADRIKNARVDGDADTNPPPNQKNRLAVSISNNTRTNTLRYRGLQEAVVTSTRLLSAPGHVPAKRHIEFRLEDDDHESSYRPGDHLAILPTNPRKTVIRAMRRFRLPMDSQLTIPPGAGGGTLLPAGVTMPVYHILSEYVELGQVATKRNIATLASSADDPRTKAALSRLATSGHVHGAEIAARRVSVLELLERYPDHGLSLGAFLEMLPPIRTRLYSISSSARAARASNVLSLTYSVLGAEGGRPGVATSYMAALEAGDIVHVAVRPAHNAFHLPPTEPASNKGPAPRPLICVAAGVGIAPFRGFIQERAAVMSATGQGLAPMLLFFGCRGPRLDDLYRDELDAWAELGAVEVYRAYSRGAGAGPDQAEGCARVQERLRMEEKRVWRLWETDGAMIYICGSKAVADGVRDVMVDIKMRREGWEDRKVGEEWWRGLANVRYTEDIFT